VEGESVGVRVGLGGRRVVKERGGGCGGGVGVCVWGGCGGVWGCSWGVCVWCVCVCVWVEGIK
jgi:hypothetical protein